MSRCTMARRRCLSTANRHSPATCGRPARLRTIGRWPRSPGATPRPASTCTLSTSAPRGRRRSGAGQARAPRFHFDFSTVEARFDQVIQADPQARFHLRVHLEMPEWWHEALPRRVRTCSNGERACQSFASASGATRPKHSCAPMSPTSARSAWPTASSPSRPARAPPANGSRATVHDAGRCGDYCAPDAAPLPRPGCASATATTRTRCALPGPTPASPSTRAEVPSAEEQRQHQHRLQLPRPAQRAQGHRLLPLPGRARAAT